MSAEIWKGAAERLEDFDLPEVAARMRYVLPAAKVPKPVRVPPPVHSTFSEKLVVTFKAPLESARLVSGLALFCVPMLETANQ